MERQFTRQAENALKLATTIAKSCGHSILSASSFACSMILLALGLYWGSFVSAAAVLP